MSRPGDELTELLWDNGPALSHLPPALFQPFTCSAAGSSRAHELDKRHGASFLGAIMDDEGIPVHHHHNDEDAVPWLHCPVIPDDGGDSDTAPLPPEYCASMLQSSGYSVSGLHAVPEPEPAADPARPLSSNGGAPGVVGVPATQPQPSVTGSGEGIMNFTFFSRPLQRPQQASTAAAAAVSQSNPLGGSTVVQQQTAASRLRNTPLFSEQRMAWFQQPPNKAPRAAVAPLPTTDHHCRPHAEAAAAAATGTTQLRSSRPDARAPDAAAAVTASSVCSANGDRSQSQSQAKRSGEQHAAAECSVSQDEDVDDEPGGAARRSAAARGTKRSRTAEVHNLSERRRRDRINEKMRALQELIPNCNKIDKASMLEEAIEYLKTLQLQVQMMSMGGAALYGVPPMLMHMQVPPPVAFPHLVGGMGLGFGGMGAAFDMRFAAGAVAPQFPCPAAMAMPHVFGVPGGVGQAVMPASPSPTTTPFLHVAAPPAEQRENDVPAPGGAAGAGDRPPPVPVGPQGDQKLQRPKQT